MKVVVLLSKEFFPQHPKAGKPTYFEQKILAEQLGKPGITIVENGEEKVVEGRKKHTCRKNYQYWKDKIDKLQEVGGVLCVRQWIGKPYKQPGQATIVEIPANVVGVQKLELRREKVETYDELLNVGTYYYNWTAKVEGYNTPVELLAENDGLTEYEFKAWFSPVFDDAEKKYPAFASISNATILDFAIIHFTKERY